MNLKKLNRYNNFDYEGFIKDKKMVLNSIKFDEKTNEIKGELAIVEDNTDYDGQKSADNLYGKINIKIENKTSTDILKYKLRNFYRPVNVVKATIWGDMKDNLSLTVGDLVSYENNKNKD